MKKICLLILITSAILICGCSSDTGFIEYEEYFSQYEASENGRTQEISNGIGNGEVVSVKFAMTGGIEALNIEFFTQDDDSDNWSRVHSADISVTETASYIVDNGDNYRIVAKNLGERGGNVRLEITQEQPVE